MHEKSPKFLFDRGAPKCVEEAEFYFVIKGVVSAFLALRILETGESILPEDYWEKNASNETINKARTKVGEALNLCAGMNVFAPTRHYDFVRDFKDERLKKLFPGLEDLPIEQLAPSICATVSRALQEIQPHLNDLTRSLVKIKTSKFVWDTE